MSSFISLLRCLSISIRQFQGVAVYLGAASVAGCVPSLDTPAPLGIRAKAEAGLTAAGGCGPALTGEVVVNEIAVRPGGLDLDGDGKSNGRDEAVELYLDASAPVHFRNAEFWIDSDRRGRVVGEACFEPGSVLVLVGPTTAPLHLPPGSFELRLDHALQLPDSGGELELVGPAGTALGRAAWDAEPDGPPSSRVRTLDGDRDAVWVRHADVPAAKGAPWSIGHCVNGGPPCACFAGQGMACGGR
ncbi:MAG: hypothetical protein EXR79_17450 [Myxococcales bacterium]|nr:hypothetical protein [Myxococcales bacterium]